MDFARRLLLLVPLPLDDRAAGFHLVDLVERLGHLALDLEQLPLGQLLPGQEGGHVRLHLGELGLEAGRRVVELRLQEFDRVGVAPG